MKTCTGCGQSKPLTEYQFQKSRGRYRAVCTECRRVKGREYYHSRVTKDPSYLEENKLRLRERYKSNKAKYRKDSLDRFHEKYRDARIAERTANREDVNISRACVVCGGSMIGKSLQSVVCCDDCARINANIVDRRRKSGDDNMRMQSLIRSRFGHMMRGTKKAPMMDTVYYDWSDYKAHLICRDTDAYIKWKNRDGNHDIDHIIPCASYDHTDIDEVNKCWNPRNLRIVESSENRKKSGRLDMDLVEHYYILDLLPKNCDVSPIGA